MIEIKSRPPVDVSALPEHIPPVLRRVYLNRGISTEEQLNTQVNRLHSFASLSGVDRAVTLLFEAIKNNQRICIVGDFDADGATSSALCVSALTMLGASAIDYLVPNRFEDGYGLSVDVVEQVLARGAEVIITVDNGISSLEGVAHAKAHGLLVIVTDHHLPGEVLPTADALVNPNLPDCGFPSKALAGVGVAFYLMMALCVFMRKQRWFDEIKRPEPKLMVLTDLVALGTVADLVALDENNRILVQQGLLRIRAGRARPGIMALIEVAKCRYDELTTADIGFSLGPRLNAAGRLENMSIGVELLLTQSMDKARMLAKELDELNQARREIEQGMKEEALAFCLRLQSSGTDRKQPDSEGIKSRAVAPLNPLLADRLPSGLVLYQADWHQGVIGILASRIKELYHRPVVAFADAGNGLLKGSCRSVSHLHMRDTLDLIKTQAPSVIKTFGGHAMAAGLSIEADKLSLFTQLFDAEVKKQVSEADLKGIILTDGELMLSDFNLELAHQLRFAGPWGQAFPEPMFEGRFKILSQRALSAGAHLKMSVSPIFDGKVARLSLDAIAFNIDAKRWPDLSVTQARLAYKLDANHFNGQTRLQLMVSHIEI